MISSKKLNSTSGMSRSHRPTVVIGVIASVLALTNDASGSGGGGAGPETPLPFYAIVYHPDEQVFWVDLNIFDPVYGDPDLPPPEPDWAVATNSIFGIDELLLEVSDYVVGPDDLLGDLDLDGAVTIQEIVELIVVLTPPTVPSPLDDGEGGDLAGYSIDLPPNDVLCPVAILCTIDEISERCPPEIDPIWVPCGGDDPCPPGSDLCCGVQCARCESCSNGECARIPCCDVPCDLCETCVNDICVPNPDPCCGVICDPCSSCVGGGCTLPDLCCGKSCPPCQRCEDGNCVQDDPCCRKVCPDCQSCQNGVCVPDDLCCNHPCEDCERCRLGQCIETDPCCGKTCLPCETCENGICIKPDPCCGKICNDCHSCQNGTCVPDSGCCGQECAACHRCSGGECIWECNSGDSCCNSRCCSGSCCGDSCCPAGRVCCGEQCCPVSGPAFCCPGAPGGCCRAGTNCCGNGECCEEECEGCLDNGTLAGGIIEVEPPMVCIGDAMTFSVSGIVDSGGIKRVECSASEAIPPVTPTYAWTCTLPPLPPSHTPRTQSGSGSSIAITADAPGVYSCSVTATAERECPPEPTTIGPAECVTPDDYQTVEILYKTFISCEVAGPTPPDFTLYDFFRGDNRGFGYGFGASQSRTYQKSTITVDPTVPQRQIGLLTQVINISQGFDDSPTGSDVVPLIIPTCGGQCSYGFVQGATPECSGSTPDPVGTGLLAITITPLDHLTVLVYYMNRAQDQCETFVPGIDIDLNILFRQRCVDGALQPLEYKANGSYDGYPWHELYLNGVLVFSHDPCLTGEGPMSMFPPAEHRFEANEEGLPTPLADWQPVP